MTTRRLRWGLVGGGHGAFIGAVHRMAARLDDRYELVAGALSSTAERSLASGRELGLAQARNYPSYREMAASEAARKDGIQVVSIVAPNDVHYDAAKTFLEAGIDVICDKPLVTELAQALTLVKSVRQYDRVFVVTYNYTGYPLVRQAREMVAAGEIGEIRLVQVEYLQSWLTEKLEDSGNKQALWRTDPARSGPGGCLGDIGTHAFHLAGFVTGLDATEISAQLDTFVPGRRLDDNVRIMMRYPNGAQGMLWASQVTPGHENDLRLRVYGSKGSLSWAQERPNSLAFARLGQPTQYLTRGGPSLGPAAASATRIPAGHPEGYLEAFAQLYKDAADLIAARAKGRDPAASSQREPAFLPGVIDGAKGVKFIATAVESSRAGGSWRPVSLASGA